MTLTWAQEQTATLIRSEEGNTKLLASVEFISKKKERKKRLAIAEYPGAEVHLSENACEGEAGSRPLASFEL